MAPSTIFAISSKNYKEGYTEVGLRRLRKRTHQGADKPAYGVGEPELDRSSQSPPPIVPEYTAVVTPEERSQRRLAGLSLNRDVPHEPFPHAAYQDDEDGTYDLYSQPLSTDGPWSIRTTLSLRDQHLAVMAAILHRSLMSRDYTRARRALGLILHCEEGGHARDIRGEGLWGIGAEILLHSTKEPLDVSTPPTAPNSVTREGFEQAKAYYDSLVVQYPPNSSWKNAVNAVDFLVAMFGLWIYNIHQESLQMPTNDENDGGMDVFGDIASSRDKIIWQMGQASRIAEAMDTCMNNVIYQDEPEIVRLRSMVASWAADLAEDLLDLDEREQIDLRFDNAMHESLDNVERIYSSVGQARDADELRLQAVHSRALAQSLFNKLERAH